MLPGEELRGLDPAELPLLAAGIVVGPFSFLIYYAALRRMNLSRATFLINTQPLFTIGLAYLVLGETLNPGHWAATLLMLMGTYAIIATHTRRMAGRD